jgi:4-oxalocrotonate tautomerase
MPHIIVKLWPGKSRQQKQRLADEITRSVTSVLGYGDESVSVGFEEVSAGDWMEKVYQPDIVARQDRLYKKPGYGALGERS